MLGLPPLAKRNYIRGLGANPSYNFFFAICLGALHATARAGNRGPQSRHRRHHHHPAGGGRGRQDGAAQKPGAGGSAQYLHDRRRGRERNCCRKHGDICI